jgi:hypothetical protein
MQGSSGHIRGLLKGFGGFIGSVAGHLLSEFDDNTAVDDAVGGSDGAASSGGRFEDVKTRHLGVRTSALVLKKTACGQVRSEEGRDFCQRQLDFPISDN